jgi:hypothetical protein
MTEITRFEVDWDGSMEPSEHGEWVRYEDAQRQERKPLTNEQKQSMWIAATIDPCSHMACYLRGIADTETAHGIKENT